MTVSNAISGIGAVIQKGDGASTEAFTDIAEVSNIGGPNISRDQHDVTTLGSTSGFREFIAGFRDGGEVVLDMNWTREGYDVLKTAFDTNSSSNYKIIMPDAGNTEFLFAGWVINITQNIPTDDKITMTATIKIDGAITETS